MKYTVKNHYGIRGETTHGTPEAALTAAGKRDGEGWEVWDAEGNRWDRDGEGRAVIIKYSDED